ncbi:MAG: hypothetical protein K1X78_09065 [Verrucomicrobiaceae bacterium]|nr:hypothetical protein [Verrucomicrobiaceae bacterium]
MNSARALTLPFATGLGAGINRLTSMEGTNDSIGRVVRDALLLCALLAGLNYVLARDDAGWLDLNPTPWLLPALLIGARYGAAAGTTVGLLTVAVLSVIRARIEGVEPWVFATQHRYPLTSFVVAGFLAGQLHHMLRGDAWKLQRGNDMLTAQVDRLRSELDIVNETRHELQQRLALHNASFASLDVELRKLVPLPPGEVFPALLHLLHRLAGVTSAGFYSLREGTLHREAVIHETAPLAASLTLARSPLAARALEEKAIASLTNPLENSKDQPFLTAVPWKHHDHEGVLLIQDMPLESSDPRNLARIEVILHWVLTLRAHAESPGGAASGRKLLPLEDFMVLLAQALETEQTHRIPSAVIRCEVPEGERAVSSDGRQITGILPVTALTTRPPSGGFVSLLPFTGEQGAEEASRHIKERLPSLRTSHYLVVGPAKIEELWSRILEL